MKRTLIAIALATSLFACKKEAKEDQSAQTQYIRIEEVDKDGTTTVSQIITVKIDK